MAYGSKFELGLCSFNKARALLYTNGWHGKIRSKVGHTSVMACCAVLHDGCASICSDGDSKTQVRLKTRRPPQITDSGSQSGDDHEGWSNSYKYAEINKYVKDI
ncbi:hypothetical protein Q3G72_021394 [Acer saccharum]|nr:hypothetical protein Q3G72_021394 [Acer saccharum]